MSITLDHSDFQCLQDQLVELKTKNYELAEKHRRGQADFEAAKAKICSLQLKLEEQERDFQVTSSTLRQEIAAVNYNNNRTSNSSNDVDPNNKSEQDYHAKYKKLLAKAKELQQRYEKSVDVIQSMDDQIKTLTARSSKLQEENSRLRETVEDKQKQLHVIEEEHRTKLESALDEMKLKSTTDCQEFKDNLVAITEERDNLKTEVDRLLSEVKQFDARLASQNEERKIQERKGTQMVKDLKRQLAAEKNRCETLQKRLESLMNEMIPSNSTNIEQTSSDIDIRGELSGSSSTNGNSHHGSSSNGTSGRANNQDSNSVSSWSLVANNASKAIKSSNQALCESLSICSIDSEDRGTIQQLPTCDTKSDSSLLPVSSSSQSTSRYDLSAHNSPKVISNNNNTRYEHDNNEQLTFVRRNSSSIVQYNDQGGHLGNIQSQATSGMSMDEQAALMERLTRLQHDKWTLEEKLAFMEQANVSLTQDLANKSDIIKHYFMDQAMRSSHFHNNLEATGVNYLSSVNYNNHNNNSQHRRTSLSSNVNQLLSEKPSLKKVVDFLKERSQVSSSESESLTREAAKKMQLMLEETLIKCLKLQENLDSVTSELNKLER